MARRLTPLAMLFAAVAQAAPDASLTLGDLAARLERGAELAELKVADAQADSQLRGLLEPLRGSRFRIVHYKLLAVTSGALSERRLDRPGLPAIAATHLDSIQSKANQRLRRPLKEKASPDTADFLFAPLTLYHSAALKDAQERNRSIIRRYEKKYGPGAPKLNIAETVLSYLLQRVPGFGPGENGAGPLEIALGYSTTYFLAYEGGGPGLPDRFAVASLWEAGGRWYVFDGWGRPGGLMHRLTPPYFGAGLAVGGEREWFLLWPHAGARFGFYLDVAGYKAAFLPGDDFRFMLGRQLQLIPHLF